MSKSNIKLITAVSFGNIIEWYDFMLFGAFAIILSHTFFPASSETHILLKIFGVLAVGYLVRPLGVLDVN